MKKRTGRSCLKRAAMALSGIMLALSIPMTVMADGEFSGDITITGTVEGYEYKAYEVLDCIAAGGEDSIFMATESWKEFLKTNENAIAMLIPQENSGDYPMAEEGSDLYTVNMESDKAVRQAFAADVLEYAGEKGIEAYESITAESGAGEITFQYLPLGIYVIDTAGRARITVMWDMGWQSEIKESYQPEKAETSTETEEKAEIQQEDVNNTEENSADESMAADTPLETEGRDSAEEETSTAEQEAPKADNKAPVMIVTVVVVQALAAVLVFVKKKK